MIQFYIDDIIKTALLEDINYIDMAADNLLDDSMISTARYIAKASGTLCGIDVALRVFEVAEALATGCEIIMLDNMDCETMKKAVEMTNGKALLEASGNITAETIRKVAETGVDIISIGALTHSVKAFDISLKIAK